MKQADATIKEAFTSLQRAFIAIADVELTPRSLGIARERRKLRQHTPPFGGRYGSFFNKRGDAADDPRALPRLQNRD
jgi:hypothetical protein